MNPAGGWRRKLAETAAEIGRPLRLMEVCGSHSVAIARYGLRDLLPPEVKLISGPGCPVCVSGGGFIDQVIALAETGRTVALFGDLLRIPGNSGRTLRDAGRIKVIYSPEEALDHALAHPQEEVVFAAVGFEPTNAAAAALLETAVERKVENFSLLTDFKHLRPALDLLAAEDGGVDGFLLPGHVASVVGRKTFEGVPLPGVISGFGAETILHSLVLLLERIARQDRTAYNNYPQMVAEEGNPVARKLMDAFFEESDGEWRGVGVVPHGCRTIRAEFGIWDAARRYGLPERRTVENNGCRCGDVLRGRLEPPECPLFGKGCTPEHPRGACMVSEEGACQARYIYRNVK